MVAASSEVAGVEIPVVDCRSRRTPANSGEPAQIGHGDGFEELQEGEGKVAVWFERAREVT